MIAPILRSQGVIGLEQLGMPSHQQLAEWGQDGEGWVPTDEREWKEPKKVRRKPRRRSLVAEEFTAAKVEEKLGAGIERLIALAESYPDLKANENFMNLQNELVETENYLQFARRYYNGSVRDYNTMTQTVPSNIVAGAFAFREREFFQKTSDDAANVPLVNLGSVE